MEGLDHIIVGQGLAGSLLAWNLIRRGRKVLVVDDYHRGASSTVAAGLVNPVTGMRVVLNPHAGSYLREALLSYRSLNRQFGKRFFHPRPLLRLFSADADLQRYRQRRADPAYQNWLGPCFEASDSPGNTHAILGGCRIHHTGFVDLPVLLDTLERWLVEQGCLAKGRVSVQDCHIDSDGIRWRHFKARRLLWCEGHQARHNPWLSWLPFQVVKGEMLNLSGPSNGNRHILNRGRWLLPTKAGQWRLGATYDRETLDLHSTPEARNALLQSLQTLVSDPAAFTVCGQQAGIRPATLDTQPFVGLLPGQPAIGVFNGFGSKGSLLIPWHARRFADYLDDQTELPAWAALTRFDGHAT